MSQLQLFIHFIKKHHIRIDYSIKKSIALDFNLEDLQYRIGFQTVLLHGKYLHLNILLYQQHNIPLICVRGHCSIE